MKILVVDDEKLLVKGIKFNLENEGYTVDACYDGESAVQLAASGDYSLIILDLMMPGLDGLEACQKIRGFSTVPIIMLTARSEDADKLLGFESGADDYVTKPFNILELKARIRALLRRASMPAAGPSASVLEKGGIEIDTEKRTARKNGMAGTTTAQVSSYVPCLSVSYSFIFFACPPRTKKASASSPNSEQRRSFASEAISSPSRSYTARGSEGRPSASE